MPKTPSPGPAPGHTVAGSARRPSASTLMGGFRVLGVAIRREPWVFTVSTLGSVLFGP